MTNTYTATRRGEVPGIRFEANSDRSARRLASIRLEAGAHAGQVITLILRGGADEALSVWTKTAGSRRWATLAD